MFARENVAIIYSWPEFFATIILDRYQFVDDVAFMRRSNAIRQTLV